ncbi:glycerol-3-phosphate dehydrogenase subunit GlpB [Herpetosiphon gulosus]|uniref:Anaerobic glycerol-3-phosphate dehydrogenase subunit B n=1 Tax=Herpetosiphon gulosus TaxID=1973496 RepID=A0ABP9X3K7_9CHLR
MQADVLVIGAGLAGLWSAILHAQAGRKVTLLAKGQGTLPWSSGCLDLVPQQPTNPDHPYSKLQTALEPATHAWLKFSQQQDYRFVANLKQHYWLPTAIGTWRPTNAVPLTMLNAERSIISSYRVLVLGFRELRDFFPPLLSARLTQQGLAARGCYLTMPPSQRSRDFNSANLARLCEHASFRQALIKQIDQIRGDAQLLLFPAVLGISHTTSIINELQTALGCLVAEVPTLPTNVAGLRLQRMLMTELERLNGRIQLNAEVIRGEFVDRRLVAVYSAAAAREQRHTADHYILATGGIGGGGLRADYPNGLRETALNLPVQQPNQRDQWFEANVHAQHQLFTSGIAVNQQLQPIDAEQQPIAENVQVVGAALAGCDPIRERWVEGLALASATFGFESRAFRG